MITDAQLAMIQTKLAALSADKSAADAATVAANAAADALATATKAASDAAAAETSADAQATLDLADLVSFVDSLVTPPAPPVTTT